MGTRTYALALSLALFSLNAFSDRAMCQPAIDESAPTKVLSTGIWGEEQGKWRTKSQLYLDPQTRQLARRTVTVWDPWPSRNYDFKWRPLKDEPASLDYIKGAGEIAWISKDVLGFSSEAVVGTYTGEVDRGRPHGHGLYIQKDGLSYEGKWREGQPHGEGRLTLTNGDELRGAFKAGKASGQGIYTDASGEVFQGWYADGHREGRGTTQLATGIKYESLWHNDVEAAQSRAFRVAQAGGTADPTNNFQLRVKVNRSADLAFRGMSRDDRPTRSLDYTGSNNGNILQIRPASTRLLQTWKGSSNIALTSNEEAPDLQLLPEVSYGIFSYGRSVTFPLNLTVDIDNRRSSAIRVISSYLDVSKSRADIQPAVQTSVGTYDSCNLARATDSYQTKVKLENFGWSAARNAVAHYKLLNPSVNDDGSSYDYKRPLGTIDRSIELNFQRDLADLGLDTKFFESESKKRPDRKSLKCEFNEKEPNIPACLSALGGPKRFGRLAEKVAFPPNDANAVDGIPNDLTLSIDAAGVLEYDWTDENGSVHHRLSPFRNRLRIGIVNEGVECGEGATAETKRQEALQLQIGKSGYRLPLAFRELIRPGKAARYSFGLNAPQSSEHDFTIVLNLEDGDVIRSRPINFLFFAPSWYQPRYR